VDDLGNTAETRTAISTFTPQSRNTIVVLGRHINMVLWPTALLLLAVVHADPFAGRQRIAFTKLPNTNEHGTIRDIETEEENGGPALLVNLLTDIRGGGAEKVAVDLGEDDTEEETSLAATTMKKIHRKKLSSVKKEVASQLAKTAAAVTKKKSKRTSPFTIVPYIVRASLNPFTFIAMVRLYWVTFFDYDYMKKRQVSGQELRSALEEKAKRSPYGGSKKAKRKMKPGQAKTLSDLPQLSS
jgi:hypothetical protein